MAGASGGAGSGAGDWAGGLTTPGMPGDAIGGGTGPGTLGAGAVGTSAGGVVGAAGAVTPIRAAVTSASWGAVQEKKKRTAPPPRRDVPVASRLSDTGVVPTDGLVRASAGRASSTSSAPSGTTYGGRVSGPVSTSGSAVLATSAPCQVTGRTVPSVPARARSGRLVASIRTRLEVRTTRPRCSAGRVTDSVPRGRIAWPGRALVGTVRASSTSTSAGTAKASRFSWALWHA